MCTHSALLGKESKIVKLTTTLHLINVTYESQGGYQCVIRNKLGMVKSQEAELTVHGKNKHRNKILKKLL